MGKLAAEADAIQTKGGPIVEGVLAGLDDEDREAVIRLLRRDVPHTEVAEWLTSKGFPCTEHAIRRWRKRDAGSRA